MAGHYVSSGLLRMTDELRKETGRKLAAYRGLNKTARKGEILFVGSSLMEMFPIEEFTSGMNLPFAIYNRGVGSYKTEDLLGALDVCVFELAPRRIFINIGTNDLSDPCIPIPGMIRNYEEILARIKERLPAVELYLTAYYPVNFDAATPEMKEALRVRTNEKIAEANREVGKFAQRVGARYVDLNDKLQDDQGNLKAEYTIEGMHIKPEGYRAIFDGALALAGEPRWT